MKSIIFLIAILLILPIASAGDLSKVIFESQRVDFIKIGNINRSVNNIGSGGYTNQLFLKASLWNGTALNFLESTASSEVYPVQMYVVTGWQYVNRTTQTGTTLVKVPITNLQTVYLIDINQGYAKHERALKELNTKVETLEAELCAMGRTKFC